MGIQINQIGVEIAGQVIRKYDATADRTTLVVDEAQAREAYDSLGTVIALFDAQSAPAAHIEAGASLITRASDA